MKDRALEKPFDVASNDETQKLLTDWDVSKTDKLREACVNINTCIHIYIYIYICTYMYTYV